MSEPATLPRTADDADTLHERDFYAWTQDQAAKLRAWPSSMRPNAVDLDHIAEEIEDLGAGTERAAVAALRNILLHLLKLEFHPVVSYRQHWMIETDAFRGNFEDLFERGARRLNPSLYARRGDLHAEVWPRVVRDFRRQMARDAPEADVIVGAALDAAHPRYDLDAQVLADDWYPAPVA